MSGTLGDLSKNGSPTGSFAAYNNTELLSEIKPGHLGCSLWSKWETINTHTRNSESQSILRQLGSDRLQDRE